MERTLNNDIVAFAETLYTVDRCWLPDGRMVRKCPIRLTNWQKKLLWDVFPPENGGRPMVRNYLTAMNKKLGKSAMAGIVAAYMAATEDNSEVYICAADKQQARDRVFKSVKYAVEHGPLGNFATAYRDRIEFSNGGAIQAFPMDYKGASGGEPVCVIFDELHAYTWEHERRLWDEFLIPPTLPHGIRWVASYAGWEGESVLLKEVWEKVQAGQLVNDWPPTYHNDEAGWWGLIVQGEGAYELVPWTQGEQGKRYLKEARDSERPLSFRRLFLNEWSAGLGDFIDLDLWRRCIDPALQPLVAGGPEWVAVGIDLAVAPQTGDNAAVVGLYIAKDGKLTTAFVKVFRSDERQERLKIGESVESLLLQIAARCNVLAFAMDPWQAYLLAERLEARGLPVVLVPQSHQARGASDTLLWQMAMSGDLRLLDCPELRDAVIGAAAKELSDGRIFISKASGRARVDVLVALSIALHGFCNEIVTTEVIDFSEMVRIAPY